jgi:hypothetical protein
MSLAATVQAKLADWRPSDGRQTLHFTDEPTGWAVSLTADRSDELGCKLWEMSVRRGSAKPLDGAQLQAWADRVAGRATGLMEPLKVVEVDPLRGEALLRSDEPSQKSEQLFYYEVLLKNMGDATVRRYQASHLPATKREQVGYALTHEAVGKLVGDLTAES